MSRIKFAATSLALAAGLAISGAAHSAITLDLTGADAQSVFTLSTAAAGQLTLVNVKIEAAPGSATTLKSTTPTVDPDSGLTFDIPAFNFPVTKASIVLDLKTLVHPTVGDAMRSALVLTRPGGRGQPALKAGLANFRIDFVNQGMNADVITATGTSSNIRLYNFTDNKDTKISFAGFKLVMTGSFKNMIFEDSTADLLGDALSISPVLRPPLKAAQWGGVTINVDLTKKRVGGKISATPITAAEIGL